MQVYNTLGRAMQPFEPLVAGKVGMYVCGPTVQSEPHLGHGRFAVAFDAIRRYLVWRGYEVTYVQNVTDVEDKIIAAAIERGVDMASLAEEMQAKFRSAYDKLNNLVPDIEPKATEHIDGMIEIITTLIDKGLAYPAGGDVYFRVRRLDGYAKLSGRNLDDLMAGARVDPGEQKEDPLDFAMWKAAKPGEPSWESPWGPGRPGWHIECSAMSMEYLGASFDIHGGGADLIFPHHENELAQSEGANEQPFATYWLHNGMMNLGGEKMSKSTGHVIDLHEAIARFGGAAVRLFYLRAHYRSPLEFSEELMADAATSLARLRAFRRRAGAAAAEPRQELMARFRAAMDDDFATPEALAVLFDIVREGNSVLDTGEDAGEWAAAFDVIIEVLGIDLADDGIDDLAAPLAEFAAAHGSAGLSGEAAVEALMAARQAARENKDWATADAIRNGLIEIGIVIEDSADGPRWHRR
jgi:cysteinyl-tRNA synthetase